MTELQQRLMKSDAVTRSQRAVDNHELDRFELEVKWDAMIAAQRENDERELPPQVSAVNTLYNILGILLTVAIGYVIVCAAMSVKR